MESEEQSDPHAETPHPYPNIDKIKNIQPDDSGHLTEEDEEGKLRVAWSWSFTFVALWWMHFFFSTSCLKQGPRWWLHAPLVHENFHIVVVPNMIPVRPVQSLLFTYWLRLYFLFVSCSAQKKLLEKQQEAEKKKLSDFREKVCGIKTISKI